MENKRNKLSSVNNPPLAEGQGTLQTLLSVEESLEPANKTLDGLLSELKALKARVLVLETEKTKLDTRDADKKWENTKPEDRTAEGKHAVERQQNPPVQDLANVHSLVTNLAADFVSAPSCFHCANVNSKMTQNGTYSFCPNSGRKRT